MRAGVSPSPSKLKGVSLREAGRAVPRGVEQCWCSSFPLELSQYRHGMAQPSSDHFSQRPVHTGVGWRGLVTSDSPRPLELGCTAQDVASHSSSLKGSCSSKNYSTIMAIDDSPDRRPKRTACPGESLPPSFPSIQIVTFSSVLRKC